ncbi:hypothetical protein Cgig2_000246 [Carnegiea gigantea]|uniref:PGG domain-containing protein n=1 Tax=Carnegiea gigantea TaxID=171969 RepID=A0A9Q1GMM6_9CARY|nr:hypothetical protein Cgig2_000246 [Carnegiea gigantea]
MFLIPISLVAALLATITFTVGFTLSGGFNSDSGEAILVKKATFLVFLIADTYAMCCSMLILFSIIWSMVYDSKRSSFLADRSVGLLKHLLYVTYNKSLWIATVVIIMCSLAILLAQRRILYKMFELTNSVTEKAHRMQMQWPSSWKQGKQGPIASNNQGQDEKTAPFTTQSEHQDIATRANITNIKMRSQQFLMIDKCEHQQAEPLDEKSESKLDSVI